MFEHACDQHTKMYGKGTPFQLKEATKDPRVMVLLQTGQQVTLSGTQESTSP